MSKNFYQGVADTIAQNNTDRQTAAGVGSFLSTALQVFQQHLQQQKLDTLANLYMAGSNAQNDQSYAVQNAQKATPVQANDPDLEDTPQYNEAGGDVYQYRDGSSPGLPPSHAQEAADNASQGFGYNTTPTLPSAPGDMPANGGMAGLRLSMLMDQNRMRNALSSARMNAALTRAGAVNDPNSLAAQRLALEKDRETRLAAGRTGAGNQPRGRQPQADTIQKLNSDVQTTYGADLNELHDAGADDIVQQPNGVLYRLGGDKKGPDGNPLPKREVFIPQAAHDQLLQRYSGIVSGQPLIVNQPQMNAVQAYRAAGGTGNAGANIHQAALGPGSAALNMYQTHLGVPPGTTGTTGATPPTAGAMQQAQAIKAQVKQGTLSQADGVAQLQALGFD